MYYGFDNGGIVEFVKQSDIDVDDQTIDLRFLVTIQRYRVWC